MYSLFGLAVLAAVCAGAVGSQKPLTSVFHQVEDPFHWKSCSEDPHYFCGYITLPLDWTNSSDTRTVDIATTLYQQNPGVKSDRTLILEPGGPGGSGTGTLWVNGKKRSEMYTNSTLDVLGFDPRGVNLSSPGLSCFPHNAYRDRWEWTLRSWPETRGYHTVDDADAMNEAIMMGCKEQLGDFPRFVSTAFVCRDVDAIREALGEELLTGFMVSYGTGIAQTYAQMFPDNVGQLVLDGLEFAVDGREPWQWGVTSLDNVTNAFQDGFIGQCVKAGKSSCALVTDEGHVSSSAIQKAKKALSDRLDSLFNSIRERPIPGTSKFGPGIVAYERIVEWIYLFLYDPSSWKDAAKALAELESENATLVLTEIGTKGWTYDPFAEYPESSFPAHYHNESLATGELSMMVICSDSYDAEKRDLDWWKDVHSKMLNQSWISASSRFFNVLPCRHFDWTPAEVYRGGFNHSLRTPLLLLGSPYDPATPLRNGRRLLSAMGNNARLVVHHGYGHSSGRDLSNCTIAAVRDYIMDGVLPSERETNCFANSLPFDSK